MNKQIMATKRFKYQCSDTFEAYSFISEKIFCLYVFESSWWFRVFGYGISCKNYKINGLLFSERSGKRKGFKIGKYIFHYLKR